MYNSKMTSQEMGQLSFKKRFAGKTPEEISAYFKDLQEKRKERKGRYSAQTSI